MIVQETAKFLLSLADRLDQMASESITGGWSTHQIAEQKSHAILCRQQAAKLLQAVLVDLT